MSRTNEEVDCDRILAFFDDKPVGVTASRVAARIGTSVSTARKRLELLRTKSKVVCVDGKHPVVS